MWSLPDLSGSSRPATFFFLLGFKDVDSRHKTGMTTDMV
jgi:hypothetical protein